MLKYFLKRFRGSPHENAMAVADIAAITVKEEQAADETAQPDPVDLEERILELCTVNSKGVTEDVITDDQPKMTKDKIVKALQRLLSMVSRVLNREQLWWAWFTHVVACASMQASCCSFCLLLECCLKQLLYLLPFLFMFLKYRGK